MSSKKRQFNERSTFLPPSEAVVTWALPFIVKVLVPMIAPQAVLESFLINELCAGSPNIPIADLLLNPLNALKTKSVTLLLTFVKYLIVDSEYKEANASGKPPGPK